jgi:hypothetical protein
MRIPVASAFLLAAALFVAPLVSAASLQPAVVVTHGTAASAPVVAWDVDLPKVDVDVDVHKGSHAWYKNPIVIGLGAVIVVLIVALASRGGGGTTIVERRR